MNKEEIAKTVINIAQLSGIIIEDYNGRLDKCEGWNSINLIKLISGCEKAFNVKFGVKAVLHIHTIEDIVSIISERRNKNE